MSAKINASKYMKYSTVLKSLNESLNYITPKNMNLGIIALITIENKLDTYLDDRSAIAVGLMVTRAKLSLKEKNMEDAIFYVNSAMMIISKF